MPAQGVGTPAVIGPWPSDWIEQAACQGLDTELFYSSSRAAMAEATGTCDRCPVRIQCLRAADRLEQGLGVKLTHGIWGGLTADERLLRRRVLHEVKHRQHN